VPAIAYSLSSLFNTPSGHAHERLADFTHLLLVRCRSRMMIQHRTAAKGGRFLAVFALLSLSAVAMGCAVAAGHGVALGSWARNPVAWVVGAAAAWGVARRPGVLPAFLLAAPVALAATLLNAPQEGVHRWIDAGPLHINAAAVLLPAATVALAVLAERQWSWLVAAASLGLLVRQPDASQAAAFGAGMIVVLASLRAPAAVRAGGVAVTVLAVVAAWLRPDPLQPVPEVEEIIGLAWAWTPLAGVAAVALLAATALWPLRMAGPDRPRVRTAALALAACCVVTALAPAFGAFPVPLVGMGMSAILGFWLGAGALAAAARPESADRAG
jgi:cell division protein FtsW (lipid II flippase)